MQCTAALIRSAHITRKILAVQRRQAAAAGAHFGQLQRTEIHKLKAVEFALAVPYLGAGLNRKRTLRKVNPQADQLAGRQLAVNRGPQPSFTEVNRMPTHQSSTVLPLCHSYKWHVHVITRKSAGWT